MIELLLSLPGRVIRFGSEHAFWACLIGIVLLSATYVLALMTYHAYVDARDIRRRR